MKELDKIFEYLNDWMKLPKYQLKRKVDRFFSIYLEEILSKKLEIRKKQIKEILPEFPLRKEKKTGKEIYASNNADYAVFVAENEKIKMYLVELKTEMDSISGIQKEYYKTAKGKKLKEILKDIIEIEKKSDQWRKYDYLLGKLERLDLIKINKDNGKNYRKEWKVITDNINKDKIEVIYITPINPENCEYTNITFKDVREFLKNGEGEFVKNFINLLVNIEKYNEEEKNRRKSKL